MDSSLSSTHGTWARPTSSRGSPDPRWQALISLAAHTQAAPQQVWEFARRWGGSEDEDLRDAVATLLLEHLLEYHFESLFSAIEVEVARSATFADCFSRTLATRAQPKVSRISTLRFIDN